METQQSEVLLASPIGRSVHYCHNIKVLDRFILRVKNFTFVLKVRRKLMGSLNPLESRNEIRKFHGDLIIRFSYFLCKSGAFELILVLDERSDCHHLDSSSEEREHSRYPGRELSRSPSRPVLIQLVLLDGDSRCVLLLQVLEMF